MSDVGEQVPEQADVPSKVQLSIEARVFLAAMYFRSIPLEKVVPFLFDACPPRHKPRKHVIDNENEQLVRLYQELQGKLSGDDKSAYQREQEEIARKQHLDKNPNPKRMREEAVVVDVAAPPPIPASDSEGEEDDGPDVQPQQDVAENLGAVEGEVAAAAGPSGDGGDNATGEVAATAAGEGEGNAHPAAGNNARSYAKDRRDRLVPLCK